MAREKFVLKINQRGNNIIYYFDENKFNTDAIEKLIRIYRARIKITPAKINPYITVQMNNKFNCLEECKTFLNYI